MLYEPSEILLFKINKKWPNRDVSDDYVEAKRLSFSPKLDTKKTTAKVFVSQIIDYIKNNKYQPIFSIFYNNKKCSGEEKDKFWVWQEESIHQDGLVHIYFNNVLDVPNFDIPIFKDPEKSIKEKYPFPGIKPLQYKRKNNKVKVMQEKLIEAGFPINEKELGYYGKETCEAVSMYYRKSLGFNSGTIVKSGKVFGPKAWKRLQDFGHHK